LNSIGVATKPSEYGLSRPPGHLAPGLGRWWRPSLAGGALLTGFDAFLLQQKKAFFTGGFLSIDHATSLADILAFLAASLLADVAVVGCFVAVALVVFGRMPLTRPARTLAVMLVGLAPLLIVDFLEYRLVAYLGDAFDLALMFDLTGRRPGELFAVAGPHLVAPLLGVLGFVAGAGAVVWIVNRLRSGPAGAVRAPRRLWVAVTATVLVSLTVTTAARVTSDVMDNGLRRKPSGKVLGSVVQAATDVDRDGYGIGGFFDDPSPFDARLFPYALDRPGNGIDENGVGGDLPSGEAYVEPSPSPLQWRHRPDVVLVVLESFRADAIGTVVNGKRVTPVLDSLAAAGIAVTRVFSHNGYTSQSRYHLMSGSLAGLGDRRTLIDDFKANGYEVGYFSGQDESFGGLSVGFERADAAYDARQDKARRYTTFTTPGSLAVPSDTVRERVAAFVAQRSRTRPLFLYLNFHDTHYPYHHAGMHPLVSDVALPEAQIGPARSRELREMYGNAVANVDRAVGDTLDVVRRHLASPPVVIVTADHGESLFDEGFLGHGYALNDAQTSIPLVVSGLPMNVEEPFGQAELRDAIRRALDAPDSTTAPRVVRRSGKRVFQYLGNLDRPRQIAFAEGPTRIIYDFRTRRVLAADAWQTPDKLDGQTSRRFLELVHYWERLVLARAGVQRDPNE
jgi:hypothetical protein